jgi:hypothetical protein
LLGLSLYQFRGQPRPFTTGSRPDNVSIDVDVAHPENLQLREVLLQHADQVLKLLHSFPFILVVPILFLGSDRQEIINAHYFYGGVGRMIRQLQQLRRSEFSLCRPVNDLKGGVGFALERASRLMLV